LYIIDRSFVLMTFVLSVLSSIYTFWLSLWYLQNYLMQLYHVRLTKKCTHTLKTYTLPFNEVYSNKQIDFVIQSKGIMFTKSQKKDSLTRC